MSERKFIPWDSETIPLSKSMVQTYDQCPYRFKRSFIDGVDISMPVMERGKRMHTVFADVFEELNYDEVIGGEFSENLLECLAVETYPEDEAEILMKFHKFMSLLYEALDYKELIFPIYSEKFLYDKKRQYYGTFDRLDGQDDSSYIVIDWKTGRYHKWNERNYRFEMMGYKHLVESQLNIKVKQFVILFLGDEHVFGPEVPHPSTVKAFYNRLNRVRNKIRDDLKSGNFKRRRQMCNWCPFEEECLELGAKQISDEKIMRNGRGRMQK